MDDTNNPVVPAEETTEEVVMPAEEMAPEAPAADEPAA